MQASATKLPVLEDLSALFSSLSFQNISHKPRERTLAHHNMSLLCLLTAAVKSNTAPQKDQKIAFLLHCWKTVLYLFLKYLLKSGLKAHKVSALYNVRVGRLIDDPAETHNHNSLFAATCLFRTGLLKAITGAKCQGHPADADFTNCRQNIPTLHSRQFCLVWSAKIVPLPTLSD